MNFVNGDGRVEPVLFFAGREPIAIIPGIVLQVRDDGTGLGAKLSAKGVGIGFEREKISVGAGDFVLVDRAFAGARKKELPNARRAARTHGMEPAVPAVEIANYADAPRGGRPYGEVDAANSIDGFQVRTEFFIGVVMAAFGHEVKVKIAELMREGVRVVDFEWDAFERAALNFVAGGFGCGGLARGPSRFEKAFGAQFYGVGNFG